MERNKITYGSRTFLQDEIKNLRCYLAASLLSTSLESNTLDFEIERADSTLTDFQQNDKLVYSYNGNVVGTFYLQSVKRIGATRYRFSAVSAIGILSQKTHAGGIYTGQTVSELITDICGNIPFVVKSYFRSIKLYGWLPYRNDPPNVSARDNLAQVLFAIGATIKTDLDGVLHIESLWNGMSGSIEKDAIYSNPSVNYGSSYSVVAVMEHQYSANTDQKALFEGTAQEGDIIVFDEPMHSLSASGFSIINSGANYAVLSSGSGKLTGKCYTHNTRRIEKVINSQATEKVKEIKNATLVSVVNSASVIDRIAAFYKCAETIKEKIVLASQKPGDIVSTFHPYDKNDVSACLQSVNITASGILAANVEALVGFEPQDITDVEYYDKREVISESGTFTVPEGVTTIRAVIIGGGSGGQAGSDGENGTSGGKAHVSAGSATESFGTSGIGGDGGDAGIGGAPGKISVIDLSVKSGDVLSIQTGVGGQGGSENGVQGESGTDTTVELNGEAFSSADGSASPTGYIDTVTGEVYAETGIAGVNGGNGGDSLKQNTPAEDGDPVGENSGGSAGTNSISSSSNSAVVFDSYTTKQTTTTTTTSAGWTEGYSSYKTGADGTLSGSGTLTYAGTKNGVFKAGPVYFDFKNASAPSSAGTVVSSMKSRSASGTSSSWTETTVTSTNSRKYVKKTMQVSKGTLASGGGGAAFGSNGDGTSGASAIKPEDPKRLGCGGNGGHGGGGGGGGGGGYVKTSGDVSNFTKSYSASGKSGGSAGKGSAGSDGANGGVILYFGVPHIIPHGAVMDNTGRFALDRTGRLMVV